MKKRIRSHLCKSPVSLHRLASVMANSIKLCQQNKKSSAKLITRNHWVVVRKQIYPLLYDPFPDERNFFPTVSSKKPLMRQYCSDYSGNDAKTLLQNIQLYDV